MDPVLIIWLKWLTLLVVGLGHSFKMHWALFYLFLKLLLNRLWADLSRYCASKKGLCFQAASPGHFVHGCYVKYIQRKPWRKKKKASNLILNTNRNLPCYLKCTYMSFSWVILDMTGWILSDSVLQATCVCNFFMRHLLLNITSYDFVIGTSTSSRKLMQRILPLGRSVGREFLREVFHWQRK